jgi:hypothetical protein
VRNISAQGKANHDQSIVIASPWVEGIVTKRRNWKVE